MAVGSHRGEEVLVQQPMDASAAVADERALGFGEEKKEDKAVEGGQDGE